VRNNEATIEAGDKSITNNDAELQQRIQAVPDLDSGNLPKDLRLIQGLLFEDFEDPVVSTRLTRLVSNDRDAKFDATNIAAYRLLVNETYKGISNHCPSTNPETIEKFIIDKLLRPIEGGITSRDEYVACINSVIGPTVVNSIGGSAPTVRHDGKRIDYSLVAGTEQSHALEKLACSGVFNSAVPLTFVNNDSNNFLETDPRYDNRDDVQGVNLNMSWTHIPRIREFREYVIETLKRHDVQVWNPFHSEPGAAYLNVEYACNNLGGQSVIAASVNAPTKAGQTAMKEVAHVTRKHAARLGAQNEILKCLDWKTIANEFNVPCATDNYGIVQPISGSKGLTLFVAALISEAYETMQSSNIAWHDTDIINPHSYDALAYLGIPLALGPGKDHSSAFQGHGRTNPGWAGIYVARTGPGRNNQPVHQALNLILGDNRLPEMCRELAAVTLIAPWLLAGERLIQGDLLRNMPWPHDMCIESQANILLAGEARHRREIVTAHVLNPTSKLECGDVAADREWKMMNYCAKHHYNMLRLCGEKNKILSAWDRGDVASFNEEFSGGGVKVIMTNDTAHTRNHASIVSNPILLPSIKMVREHKLANFGAIVDAVEKWSRK
jgi:hypothetical protein